MFIRKIKSTGLFISASLIMMLAGCSSSDDDLFWLSRISGKVVDGYVSGATLTVYGSEDFTVDNVVGSGSTDATGAFNLTLNTLGVPDPIYIKSEGGIDTETGLPAPVMLFAGSADANGGYNITPLTDTVFRYISVEGSLDDAQNYISGALGISESVLGSDPQENSSAADALAKVLASGTQTSTLDSGNYELQILYFQKDDLGSPLATLNDVAARIVTLPVTVDAEGVIDNEIAAAEGIDLDYDSVADELCLSGGVVGSSMFISIDINEDEDAGTGTAFSFSGEIGPFGSLSGCCSLRPCNGPGEFKQGVFVATLTPDGITAAQRSTIFNQLGDILASDQSSHLLFSDVLIDGTVLPQIRYGTILLTADGTTGFDYTNLTVDRIHYNGLAVDEASVWNNASGNLDYLTAAAQQTRILAALQDDTFFILPAGGRRGMAVTVGGGNVTKAARMFINRTDSLAPVLEAGTTYNLAQVCIGTFVLNNVSRTDALTQVIPTELQNADTADDPQLTVPGGGGSGYNDGEIFAVSGSFLATKSDADDDFDDGPATDNDFVMAVEMYETGALTGVRLNAGTYTVGVTTYNNYDSPLAYVMFAYQDDSVAPAFRGTMKFMAREFIGGIVVDQIPIWSSGELTIDLDQDASTGTGSLHIETIEGCGYSADDRADADAVSGSLLNYPSTVDMSVERIGAGNSGLLHIYGTGTYTIYYTDQTDDRDYYWDIYWAVGAPKAAYMFSFRDDAGTFRVNEIGEAYITY